MTRTFTCLTTSLIFALLSTSMPTWAEVALPSTVAAHLDAESLQLARAYVPDASRRVGEVRLLRHGTTRIAQTLLYTKLMRRVISEIARKERNNWPAERVGHGDAQRYLDALTAAAASLPKPKTGGRNADRTQRLLIEFVDADDVTGIAFSRFASEDRDGEVRIIERTAIAWLPAERSYVAANVDLIAADALHLDPTQVQTLWQRDPQQAP